MFSNIAINSVITIMVKTNSHLHFLVPTVVNFINVLREQFPYKILAPKTRFRAKNVRVKRWWNWHLVSLIHCHVYKEQIIGGIVKFVKTKFDYNTTNLFFIANLLQVSQFLLYQTCEYNDSN